MNNIYIKLTVDHDNQVDANMAITGVSTAKAAVQVIDHTINELRKIKAELKEGFTLNS